MKKLLLVTLLIAAIVGISVFSTYAVRRDQIATRRASVDKAWAQVSQAIARRADFAPAVLATVKNTAARNREVVKSIEDSRSAINAARTPVETIAANRELDSAMARLFAAAQNDPDLLVNTRFFTAQDRWTAASNAIVPARQRYDDAVQDYNAFISDFPNDVFATWASYRPLENYFSADANAASESTAALMKR